MEHLVVIVRDGAPKQPPGTPVLRFAGTPEADEIVPPDIAWLRDEAATLLKERFASWLYGWARHSGALDLAEWEGGLSWWWYTPLSERSPLRSDLLHRLEQLLLLRAVLLRDRPRRLTWYDSSRILEPQIAALAAEVGCRAVVVVQRGKWCSQRWSRTAARVKALIADCLRAAILRRRPLRPLAAETPQILFLTRFPILWRWDGKSWTEIMFGRLPQHCESAGIPIAYAATLTGAPWRWLAPFGALSRALKSHAIHPLLAEISVAEVIAVHAMRQFRRSYRAWRARQIRVPVTFEDIDVTALLWRELDTNLCDPDLAANRIVAMGVARLVKRLPEVRILIHPFEFQPLERAAYVGAKAQRPVSVVGLQTGIFTSGQLGFLLDRAELRLDDAATAPRLAPVPDLLVAYGRLPREIFTRALGRHRVLGIGALRYGSLAERLDNPSPVEAARARLGLSPSLRPVLVACPSIEHEAWPIVRAALRLAEVHGDLLLIFKFHYHLRLDREVAAIAECTIAGRWRMFDDSLHDLIIATEGVITGASSVSYEALALGRPVMVYLPPATLHCNMATETPDAFAFWTSERELAALFDALSSGTFMPSDEIRKDALEAQLTLRADAEERLVAVLREQLRAGSGNALHFVTAAEETESASEPLSAQSP